LRGVLITLEGIDGSGKSTQARLLEQELRRMRVPVLLTREPGGSPFGEQIRYLLLDPKFGPLSGQDELLLFEAARRHHLETVLLPALKAGKVVLCDRFMDSTLAYQAFGRGLDPKTVELLNAFASGGLKPGLTLVFDIPAKEGLQRSGRKGRDRMEASGRVFMEKVRRGFLALARREKGRIKVIPMRGLGPGLVLQEALALVKPFLKRKGYAI
jgi:dTMP kinase